MPDSPRIDDLRRRVQKDPASIAFAQLVEEYRRAGRHQEAVDTCRTGLAIHPDYLSARVTLGRALVELGQLSGAQRELKEVLDAAPEQLAAIRALADIHRRRGELSEALVWYRTALRLAHNDPELQSAVEDLEHRLTPPLGSDRFDVSTFEKPPQQVESRSVTPSPGHTPSITMPGTPALSEQGRPLVPTLATRLDLPAHSAPPSPIRSAGRSYSSASAVASSAVPEQARAMKTLAVLEEWLTGIHVARADRHP